MAICTLYERHKTVTITINDVMDRYTFDSKLIDGDSSVSYTGQTGRHVLIAELNNYIKNQLEADVDDGKLADKAAVLAKLNYFYSPDKDTEYDDIAITFIDNSKDGLLSDITGYKSIKEKVAGNDTGGQHEDWNNGAFAGWGAKGSTTPTDLIADTPQQEDAPFQPNGEKGRIRAVITDITGLARRID